MLSQNPPYVHGGAHVIILYFTISYFQKFTLYIILNYYFVKLSFILALTFVYGHARSLECITGNMVRKVLESSGFSKLVMKFVWTEFLSSSLILLESRYQMKVLRYLVICLITLNRIADWIHVNILSNSYKVTCHKLRRSLSYINCHSFTVFTAMGRINWIAGIRV